MRPDEHKRKKNAQYKQKHGIKSTKKASSESDHRSKSRDDRHEPHDVRHDKNVGSKDNLTNEHVNDKPNKSLSGVGNEALSSSEVAPTFHKRKLASNWERYAEPDAEEVVTQRGADFQDVLASTGGSLAGFRFKDEEDWLMEEDLSGHDSANFLSVDCERLASTLLNIPLHERLNIEASAFDKRHIELFLEQAESNKAALKTKPFEIESEVSSKDIHHVISDTSTSGLTPDTKLAEVDDADQAAPNVTVDDDVLDDILGYDEIRNEDYPSNVVRTIQQEIDCPSSVKVSTNQPDDHSTSITLIKNMGDTSSFDGPDALNEQSTNKSSCIETDVSNENENKLEKDIDDLFQDICIDEGKRDKSHHIESPQQEHLDKQINPNTHLSDGTDVVADHTKLCSDKPVSKTVINREGTVNIEDELDFLLSLEGAVTSCDQQKPEVANTEQNDLDDWLDSMVDD